ncbi:hypothetical protein CCR85_10085 [Rhodothalassium salexigens]|uniref:HdaA/DnaA family protein n=1 Tax=Rhodothalassium salexigens TaxID=1086 RepID=UPI0019114935|nr:DnaA/Hda family protein [Rhodothalassium salexigens]MBK5911836.1 hypothetical protein [Rhodothalassium salexigens]MBK5922066.1 hypothetical protein [Rhodothalassium salexigens]
MTTAEQLTFPLPHRPALGQADFLVAPPNEAAVALVDAWPDWPGPALALVGPPGSGKSHLAQVWAQRAGARTLDPLDLYVDFELGDEPPAVLVEDADRGVDETALFHLYNVVREQRGHLMLTGREAPARWPVALPDLRSRLATVPVADMGMPDDRLLAAVLVKQFADRQLRVAPPVISYLVTHMDRSFDAARRLVAALDEASLREGRSITRPLANRILGQVRDAG